MTDDRVPPHDLLAEKSVLGAMMLAENAISSAYGIIGEAEPYDEQGKKGLNERFFRPAHQLVYAAIMRVFDRGEPVDALTVSAELTKNGEAARTGGAPYLLELVQSVPVAANAGYYARTIVELYARRKAMEEAATLLEDLHKGRDVGEALEHFTEETSRCLTESADSPGWATRFRSGGGFVLDVPDRPPAIWGEGEQVAWADGEALMLCGPPGVGKTTLVQQLVEARLGLSETLLDLPVQPSRKRVLYLAMDRPPQIARAAARLFRGADRRVLDERLIVWEGPPPQDFARHPNLLAEMCAHAHADTVIVDSLKDAVLKLSDDESGSGYNRARQTALVQGVQVVELHHQRKAGGENKKPSALSDVYGSVWLTAGAGSVILLWGEPGDPVVDLIHLKQPAEPLGPFKVTHDHTAGRSTVYHRADLLQMAQTWSPTGSTGLTAQDAAKALFDKAKPTPAEVEKARRKLETLRKSGHLVKHEGSPAKYYRVALESA